MDSCLLFALIVVCLVLLIDIRTFLSRIYKSTLTKAYIKGNVTVTRKSAKEPVVIVGCTVNNESKKYGINIKNAKKKKKKS